jgi:hypothetical protein
MLAVALNGLCLQYASVELRADRQVVLQAIRSNPYAFLGQNGQNRRQNPWKSPWTSVVYQCLGINIMLKYVKHHGSLGDHVLSLVYPCFFH